MCAYNGIQTKSLLDSLQFDFFVNFGTAASYKKSEQYPLQVMGRLEVAETFITFIEKHLIGGYNCCGNDLITLVGLVQYMGKLLQISPKILYDPSTDGVNWNEDAFPFANENFICSNAKIKEQGITFASLFDHLQRDFESYYIKQLAWKA